MAKHSRALHFRTGSSTDDVTLYTTLGEVVDPAVINADQTTGGAALYTVGTDVGYPALRVRDGNDTVFGALVSPSDKRATNLRVRYNNTTYAVGKTSTLGAYGICYFQQEANGPWTWARVDEDGNPLTENPNFDYIAPWSDIETVVIDGQTMVKIPKFYVKADTIASGTYAGAKARWVCASKKDGYHIHPAFVRDGFVLDCFYVGAYEASIDSRDNKYGSIANVAPANIYRIYDPATLRGYLQQRNTDATNASKRGWDSQDIYTAAAINYLLLIELGTPDAQTAIAAGNVTSGSVMATGTTSAIYRGIHEWWGNENEFVYGSSYIYSNADYSQTLNNQRDANVAVVLFDFKYASNTYINDLREGLTEQHLDYSDVFKHNSNTNTISSAVIPDNVPAGQYANRSYILTRGGRCNSDTFAGPFSGFTAGDTNSQAGGSFALRIVKDGEKTSEAAPSR